MTDFEAVAGFTVSDAIVYFQNLSNELADVAFRVGPHNYDMPHRMVTVSGLSGSAPVMEGILEDQHYQVRCRGKPRAPADAQNMASHLDLRVLQNSSTQDVNGKRVITVYREGSAPVPLPGTPDNADRTEYIATYRFRVATYI